MAKKVLLMTSTNLASNPRCLKELRLLLSRRLDVTVVAFNLHNLADEKEKALNREFSNVRFHYLEGSRRSFFLWLISSLFEKVSRILILFIQNDIFWMSMATSKRSWLLLNWVKATTAEYDLIIGHNPASFYPSFFLADKKNIPFALDIEDYHPGEYITVSGKKSVAYVMEQLISKAAYTSFASPLIMQYTKNLLKIKSKSLIIVNNLFPRNEFIEPAPITDHNGKIRLVWFSQYIDYKRGLEKILPVLDEFQDKFELTLIGGIRRDFLMKELKLRKYISSVETISHENLQKELSHYDIGLAIEDGTSDLNRNICLTNKIWSYFQAGLFIIASDTKAQKFFIEEYPSHGICTSLSKTDLYTTFENILKSKDQIRNKKVERFKKASFYNWEKESVELVNLWDKILQ